MPVEPLAGTVKPYTQHLAVCTGGPPELWAARVEDMEGLFDALYAALMARDLHRTIKLTACDAVSNSAAGFDIFLLPDMLVLPAITVEQVGDLADALAQQFERGLPFDVRPMPGGDHLFVCTHGNRDDRCGTWGEPLYQALQREIEAQGAIAQLHRSSHVGGHRYAATCLVYPQGVWYGNLRPDDAARLVDRHLNHEQLLPDHYRGRLGASACQQVAEAEAARVLLERVPEYESLRVELSDEADQRATALATATFRDDAGWHQLQTTFTLSCPNYQWTVDGEILFQ